MLDTSPCLHLDSAPFGSPPISSSSVQKPGIQLELERRACQSLREGGEMLHPHTQCESCVVQPSADGAALTGGLMEDTTARWRGRDCFQSARERKDWALERWRKVMWSDESRSTLLQSDGASGSAQIVRERFWEDETSFPHTDPPPESRPEPHWESLGCPGEDSVLWSRSPLISTTPWESSNAALDRVLQLKLQQRRTREELASQGIMPHTPACGKTEAAAVQCTFSSARSLRQTPTAVVGTPQQQRQLQLGPRVTEILGYGVTVLYTATQRIL
ncbi:hypothetical protein NFI96_012145 [Prochilodus magdalenae]|nr:hypothetical protein NFI96_012145 [Prochilodus magdalenae]